MRVIILLWCLFPPNKRSCVSCAQYSRLLRRCSRLDFTSGRRTAFVYSSLAADAYALLNVTRLFSTVSSSSDISPNRFILSNLLKAEPISIGSLDRGQYCSIFPHLLNSLTTLTYVSSRPTADSSAVALFPILSRPTTTPPGGRTGCPFIGPSFAVATEHVCPARC